MSADPTLPEVLDPGHPIDVPPTYFRIWVEAVRLHLDPAREQAPLAARADLFPIIFRYYHPQAGARRVNPSWYLSKMKKAGILRLFDTRGEGFFWVPVTDVVLRMNKVIVYTPDDLPALLAQDARFVPQDKQAPKAMPPVKEPAREEGSDETPVSGLTLLDRASLNTALARARERFDVTKLEARREEFAQRIAENESRAAALRREINTVEEEGHRLASQRKDVEQQIQQLKLEEEEDQHIADMRWLIENFDRHERIMRDFLGETFRFR